MLKIRIAASILINRDIVVQSKGFTKYLPVGRCDIAAEAFVSWGADEIFLIDISATKSGKTIGIDHVKNVAQVCDVPLTVIGGVRTVNQIGEILLGGADRVGFNSAFIDRQPFVHAAKLKYGRQCIVACIDFVFVGADAFVFDYRTQRITSTKLVDALEEYYELGAGEFLINDVARDGRANGFNVDLMKQIVSLSKIPVVWCGGAGTAEHFRVAAVTPKLSGLAAANCLHYTEHSIQSIKSCLVSSSLVRQ